MRYEYLIQDASGQYSHAHELETALNAAREYARKATGFEIRVYRLVAEVRTDVTEPKVVTHGTLSAPTLE